MAKCQKHTCFYMVLLQTDENTRVFVTLLEAGTRGHGLEAAKKLRKHTCL